MSQKSARGGAGGGKAPAKGKKAQGGGKKAEDDREETLQAVVCVPILWAKRRYAKSLTDTCGFI